MKDNLNKKFFLSSWAIDNRTAVYLITIIITLAGLMTYNSLPKEKFPEIKFPQIIVQTIYPGTSPENMENLVTKHIEKECKNLTGIKKVTSNSFQDYSVVIVEFQSNVKVDKAKRDVKDAVDKARSDLPKNLPNEPEVKDVDISEMPILYVNISGNYDLSRLKKYADKVKDKIELLKEVKRVDLVGALDREIQINVDAYKMQAAGLTFDDIDRAVASENVSVTAGEIALNNQKRILSLKNEFKSADQIGNIVVKSQAGSSIYLHDIADVRDSFEEQKSYASMDGKPVISLNIIKASGQNLIDASDKVQDVVKKMQKDELPKDLNIGITGDQSDETRSTLHDLINTIIIGFILVTVILMFFMGVTNALFVAMSVPLSCAIAFLVMPTIGFTLNMIVLFSFLLALGIVVDDAIVVIENTHRIFDNGKVPIKSAAKLATGEIFLPVLSGTATTLMPFVPLAFWPGTIGNFMFYLPITLIITLLASLLVAYVINPVFAVDFMKPHDPNDTGKRRWGKKDKIVLIVAASLAAIGYLSGGWGVGNFVVFLYGFVLLEKFVLEKVIHRFQNKTWPRFQDWYTRWLKTAMAHPGKTLGIMGIIFIFAIVGISMRSPKVDFFPSGDPNFAYVYLNMPVGTDQAYTNTVLKDLEGRVDKALDMDGGKKNPNVTSIISNVTVNAVDPTAGEVGEFPNKGRIQVAFAQFSKRSGKVTTREYLERIRSAVKGVPGAEVTVDKEGSGPPTGKPVAIEITCDNLDTLVSTSERLKRYLMSKNIHGLEELRSDFQAQKPEVVFDIDRERMNNESISTAVVATNLRTAVFGKEVSRFRDAKDDYPITLRYKQDQRGDIDAIRNMSITYRDMGMGGIIRHVPVSAFANVHYDNTYGGIKRKNEKRIITLSSNVTSDANGNEVVATVQREMLDFKFPPDVSVRMGGEQEDQAETMGFLGSAGLASIALIFLILILQFNSISRTFIIMSEILFSIFGVLIGWAIFGNTISIVMSGMGIVALMGVVVRNGILLVEFMDLMLKDGMTPYDAIVEAGRTRMTPVLLTAASAILGLIPLAVGLNIDFATLFSELNPHIFFGGDSGAFWGPLAWTMIYGLSFATFLTLIMVPVMMLLSFRLKSWIARKRGKEPIQVMSVAK